MNGSSNQGRWDRLDRNTPRVFFDEASRERTQQLGNWIAGQSAPSAEGLAEVVAAAEDELWLDADRRARQVKARQYRGLGSGEPGD